MATKIGGAPPLIASSPNILAHTEARMLPLRTTYATCTPWPHVVIDDFLPPEFAAAASKAFPRTGKLRAFLARVFEARAYGGVYKVVQPTDIPIFADITDALGSPTFIASLEHVTGIEGLRLDRTYAGGGFNMGVSGSYLRLHADHNTHPANGKLYRRINVLIYLHEYWERQWNGDLEIWDRTAKRCVKVIEPLFNRCVIMSVDDTAFHGYGPLAMPSGRARNVLAAYYYADTPADGQVVEPHGTIFPSVGGETRNAEFMHRLRRRILARIEKFLNLLSR